MAFSAGFMLNMDGLFGPSPHAFGHSGWGGSFAFADPDAGLGVAYVMNRMQGFSPDPDPRRIRLLDTGLLIPQRATFRQRCLLIAQAV